jgi:predicted metal-dependent enzyme (double-stranded beta helix superfamily)
MFDRDRFVADCQAALKDAHAERAVREVVARAVDDPADVLKGLGEPEQGGVQLIHKAPDLTIINVIWSKYMTILPHNHEMWAVIGIYTGREDNIFWRRIKDEAGGRIEPAGAKALAVKDAVPLGKDIIHSVTNPIPRLSGAIHVYGGDFFGIDRSEWNPETLLERPYDVAKNLKILAGDKGVVRGRLSRDGCHGQAVV